MKKYRQRIICHCITTKELFQRITLIDKCLLLFMTILLLQSIYNLFVNEIGAQNSHQIDILVRTTSASIFGYFLSSNFAHNSINRVKPQAPLPRPTLDKETVNKDLVRDTVITNQIVLPCEAPSGAPPLSQPNPKAALMLEDEDNLNDYAISRQQILIATTIGIVSLLIILTVRNLGAISNESIATIAQLRDFVSGCVGFLLGCNGANHTPPKK